MSVLGAIFAILMFFVSPWGLACVLAGFLAFFMLPIASAVSSFKTPAHFLMWLASQPIRRAAIVVSEANDIIFKQMSYQGIGVESVTLGDDEKLFGDPDGALHRWLGMPFALANEEHGVLFDPRHAAAGKRKHDLEQKDDSEYPATEDEYAEDGVTKWIPGAFEMPTSHELVDLSKVTELIDGGERAEYPVRVEELYKHSQDPFADATPMMKFLYPVIGWAIPFFGIWLLADQLGGPAGGAGSTVGYGSTLLLLAVKNDVDWRRAGRVLLGVIVFLLMPAAILIGIALVFNPLLAVAVLLAFGMGFLMLPILSFLSRPSKRISGAFSNLFFRLGFMGYETPIFYWTPERYELREYRTLDDTHDVTWYSLFGKQVGFTFPPEEESWGAEVMDRDELQSEVALADGGEIDTNVPDTWRKTKTMRKDNYGGLVPADLSDDAYYLNSQIALGRFTNSAVGEKSLRRLLEAKDKYGGGEEGIADRTVIWATVGMAILGIGMGVFFFLL